MPGQLDILKLIQSTFSQDMRLTPQQCNKLLIHCDALALIINGGPIGSQPGEGIEMWLKTDEVGTSSMYLLSILKPGIVERQAFSFPYEASDFYCCNKLLQAAPELIKNLYLIETQKVWNNIVPRWSEFVALMNHNPEELTVQLSRC